MLRRILGILLLIACVPFCLTALAARDPNDAEGCQDPPFFTRMPGYSIYTCEDLEFDRFEFTLEEGKIEAVEGHRYRLSYQAKEGAQRSSGLQIVRNYANAAKSIGGQVLYEDNGFNTRTLKVTRDKAEIWAYVSAHSDGSSYEVEVIEKQLMEQVVEADASSLAAAINETGRAAVYGIYFDTGKAVIKAESDAAIGEIATLLKNDPGLKLYVVGHTDNVGAFDYNIKLSQGRAASVVDALAKKHGIAGTRLTPFGVGPVAPAAANNSEEGRAKNRRVELVAQ